MKPKKYLSKTKLHIVLKTPCQQQPQHADHVARTYLTAPATDVSTKSPCPINDQTALRLSQKHVLHVLHMRVLPKLRQPCSPTCLKGLYHMDAEMTIFLLLLQLQPYNARCGNVSAQTAAERITGKIPPPPQHCPAHNCSVGSFPMHCTGAIHSGVDCPYTIAGLNLSKTMFASALYGSHHTHPQHKRRMYAPLHKQQ